MILPKHTVIENEVASVNPTNNKILDDIDSLNIKEGVHNINSPTILIVEDNVSMVNYPYKKLQMNYNVHFALDGSDALKKMKGLPMPPDLIISDIMMDKVDGYAFAKIISNDPAYSHIPFIFLSAKSARTDKLQGLKLGAIDFIQKPFSMSELTLKIEAILANAGKQKKAVLNTALNGSKVSETVKSKSVSDTLKKLSDLQFDIQGEGYSQINL